MTIGIFWRRIRKFAWLVTASGSPESFNFIIFLSMTRIVAGCFIASIWAWFSACFFCMRFPVKYRAIRTPIRMTRMTSKMIVTVFKDLPPDSDRLYDGSLSVQLFNSIILSDYLQLTYDRDAAPRAPREGQKMFTDAEWNLTCSCGKL